MIKDLKKLGLDPAWGELPEELLANRAFLDELNRIRRKKMGDKTLDIREEIRKLLISYQKQL